MNPVKFETREIDSNGISLTLSLFEPSLLPKHFKTQILDFYRCVWPWGFHGNDQFRDWITGEDDFPQHLILSKGEILVGAVTLVRREIDFENCLKDYGKIWVSGITGMLIYPNFQGQGWGKILVQESLKILQESSEVTLFHCESNQKEFYQKCGFRLLERVKVSSGKPAQAVESTGVMVGYSHISGFLEALDYSPNTLYFGPYTW